MSSLDDDVLDDAPTDLWIRPEPAAPADVMNADEVARLCEDPVDRGRVGSPSGGRQVAEGEGP